MTIPMAMTERIPIRSASHPMGMPPNPVPTQTNEPARATTDRSVPNASWIVFSPTTISSGEPYEIDRIASVTAAATQEPRPSMLGGRSDMRVSFRD